MESLILTTDEPPVEPVTAHTRPDFELLLALSKSHPVHVIVYADERELLDLRERWKDRPVDFHVLRRRKAFRHVRGLVRGLSLPTVTRDFKGEEAVVRGIVRRNPGAKLVISYIAGAPLLARINGPGTMLSSTDCMSYFCSQQGEYSTNLRHRLGWELRRWFCFNAERRYAHLAECVHMVSEMDALKLRAVNPLVQTRVIGIATGRPDRGRVLPWARRHRKLVWGNLSLGPVLEGFRQILRAARQNGSRLFDGWMVLGRAPEVKVRELLPELENHFIEYRQNVPDMTDLLGETKVLLLPDIGGAGQKNRTYEGLSHGCCVVGFGEAFRGLETLGRPAYVKCETADALIGKLVGLSDGEAADLAERGVRLFEEHCSREALESKWNELVNSIGTLSCA